MNEWRCIPSPPAYNPCFSVAVGGQPSQTSHTVPWLPGWGRPRADRRALERRSPKARAVAAPLEGLSPFGDFPCGPLHRRGGQTGDRSVSARARAGLLRRCPAALAPPPPRPRGPARPGPPRPAPAAALSTGPLRPPPASCGPARGGRRLGAARRRRAAAGEAREVAEAQAAAREAAHGERREQAWPGPRAAAWLQHARPAGAAAAAAPLAARRALLLLALVLAALLRLCGARHR